MKKEYPQLFQKAIQIPLPFYTTYLQRLACIRLPEAKQQTNRLNTEAARESSCFLLNQ